MRLQPLLYSLVFFVFSIFSFASDSSIYVGEGVSLGSKHLNLLASQNPTALANVDSFTLGASQFKDSSTGSNTYNEFGFTYGGSTWGLALDYQNIKDSSSDNTYYGFGVGFDLGGFSLGFNTRANAGDTTDETLNASNLGISINPAGTHRFGVLIYNWADSGSSNTNQKWAFGYAYVNTNYSFLIDYVSYSDDRNTVTPGFVYFNESFQFSVSKRQWQNSNNSVDENVTKVALGLYFAQSFHFSLYNNVYKDSGFALHYKF